MARLLKAPRSANRASTPVKASRSPPKALQPCSLLRIKYWIAKDGLKALRTVWSKIARLYIPLAALNSNQITTMGAKEVASLEIPNGWTRKRRARMAHVTPIVVPSLRPGAATLIP
jgi:hypothetical protein